MGYTPIPPTYLTAARVTVTVTVTVTVATLTVATNGVADGHRNEAKAAFCRIDTDGTGKDPGQRALCAISSNQPLLAILCRTGSLRRGEPAQGISDRC